MKLKVLKQFSHFRLGAFIAGEIVEVSDEYAGHLIEIGVAGVIHPAQPEPEPEPEPEPAEAENGNKRTRSRKS